jgi:hypothetical protein
MEKGNSSLWGAAKKRYKVGRKKWISIHLLCIFFKVDDI